MIEVENLTKYYGTFPALRDVNFNVERGEVLGFLGPNGAGKTTTMRIITGYIPPTSGTVRVAGFDVGQKSMDARKHLGYLPETVPLYPELTPWEYLDFKGRISGLQNARERHARMVEIMDRVNLGDVSGKLIGSLSRGYRQRVGLAQAMLHNPDVLILDEPTVGLDPVQITDARDLIKELGRDHTIILSTHLLPEVSMVCNRVIIINRGKLIALDTPFHLAESTGDATIQLEVVGERGGVLATLKGVSGVQSATPLHPGTVGTQVADKEPGDPTDNEVTGAVKRDGGLSYSVEVKPNEDVRARLSSAIIDAGYSLLEMRSVRPTLEEIFIRVITQAQGEELQDGEGANDQGSVEGDYEDEEASEGAWRDDEMDVPPVAPTVTRVTTKRRVRR